MEVASFEDMWAMLTSGAPPVQALLDRVGADGRERLMGTLAKIVDERYGSGPIATTNVANVAVGTAS